MLDEKLSRHLQRPEKQEETGVKGLWSLEEQGLSTNSDSDEQTLTEEKGLMKP